MTVKNFINSSGDLDYPAILPTLDLNFANSKTLDPRITFTRSSGGSYAGPDGIIKYAGVNQPRFDHDPSTGESLGLLIEESRKNLLLQSNGFNTAYWSKYGVTLTSNSITSPDGTTNAYKQVENATSDLHRFQQGIAKSAVATTYTFSVFVKSGERNGLEFGILDAGGFVDCFANSTAGVFTGVPLINGAFVLGSYGSIAYPNGWYRFYVTATTTAQTGVTAFIGTTRSAGAANNYQGDGTSGIYIWGAQLEEGEPPTSYIPTITSTRTRAADAASITGTKFSSWYNQNEGTIYWNASRKYDVPSEQYPGIWQANDSTPANLIAHSFLIRNLSSFNVFSNNKQVALIYPITKVIPLLNRKSSAAYKIKDYATSLNGSLYKSNASGPVPIVTQLNIGGNQFGYTYGILNGTISRLTYYPKRLPDSQLQTLTR